MSKRRSLPATLALFVSLHCLAARAEEPAGPTVPEAQAPRAVKPGETALITAKKGMKYFLRVPRSYEAKRGARLIVFLHGSNMNGHIYLRSFESAGWCKTDLLVCPNGETGGDPYGSNNFTFDSAAFIAEVTRDVQQSFRVTHTFIGGHSQGAYVTYSVIMLHPELYQGAFPIAGTCWSQNEPNLWEEQPEILARQKRIALAVIHGKADPVVPFEQGLHAYNIYVVAGYPSVRLFAPEELGHQFLLSPVPEALAWLEAMVGADPTLRAAHIERFVESKEWGWAVAAAKGMQALAGVTSGEKDKAKRALAAAEQAARAEVKEMAKRMETAPAREWLPKLWEFRRRFGGTGAAASIVKRYEDQRAKQRQLGRRLFAEARGLMQAGDTERGHALLHKLLEEAPCCYEAYWALEWLADEPASGNGSGSQP
ncbi:MAG: hypothetical protein L0Z55_02730 [Planctomycetes bacterium]|nr:hypothetical protein [Planctomycetota bacterium]